MNFKVFLAVVLLVSVLMMDDLGWQQGSSEHLTGDEAMFIDVAANIGHGIVWHLHKDIATIRQRSTTSPVRITFSRMHNPHTFRVTYISPSVNDGFRMSEHSKIEWTDSTWNPVTGCTKVSAGCKNCYAERLAPRLGQNFSEIILHPDRLDVPLHWKKPRRIFVNSLSDLFHEDVPDEFILDCLQTMKRANKHIYQVLTKRPERMLLFMQRIGQEDDQLFLDHLMGGMTPHLDHVWMGISCEDQKTADERIPLLLQTPAAVRFISAEPLLGPIDISPFQPFLAAQHQGSLSALRGVANGLNWVIVGGESGPHARPMHQDWARSLRDQCQAAGVPFFFKQWGEWVPWDQQPNDIYKAPCHEFGKGEFVFRIGKKAAGRMLDGRTWDEMPKGRADG